MKVRNPTLLVVVLLLCVAFGAGLQVGRRSAGTGGSPGPQDPSRKVLYWVDPMNPAFRSDRPWSAPCGMPLEPVYADAAGGGTADAALPAGAVLVRPDRQQLIGVRTGVVEERPVTRALRWFGRVAADENRIHRLNPVTTVWIRELSGATTGSLIRQGELLGSFYSQEVLGPQQAFIYALEALDRFRQSEGVTEQQIQINEANVRTTRQTLLNLAVPPEQIMEIEASRKVSQTIQIRAPVTGFVLSRNASLGQRFDPLADLFVIADLSRVWVLADVFRGEQDLLKAGAGAVVRLPGEGKVFPARVCDVPPAFDSTTRTLKVRLEAENPDHALRPGMLVDVEMDVSLPARRLVPAEAVVDSGLRKVVYVDRGNGVFEPRRVETGLRLGDAIEIAGGLETGERIVVSGNFLLDSESRMRTAAQSVPPAAPAPRAVAKDPICGMDVDEEKARAAGLHGDRDGTTWFFCGAGCKARFEQGGGKSPEESLPPAPRAGEGAGTSP